MKKIAVTLCLTAIASAALAQGTVNPANTAGTTFRTNAIATGGTSGNTAAAAGGFLYEVLTAPSSVTTVDSSLQGLLSGPWSDTALKATNTTFASGGRMNGPSGSGGTVANWAGGAGQSFIIVGWSSNLGSTWAAVSAELAGAQLTAAGGSFMWTGGSFTVPVGQNAFLGASTIQAANSGAPDGTGAFSLFGAAGGTQGTPITTPTSLFMVNVPEPTSMAIVGLGLAAGMVLRRRK